MNKKYLNQLIKKVKKESDIKLRYEPTLEECDYLFSKGISVTNGHLEKFDSLLTNIPFYLDFILYGREI